MAPAANLAKCLLYAQRGRDRREQVGPRFRRAEDEYLNYEDIMLSASTRHNGRVYVNALKHHPLHARQVLLRAHSDGPAPRQGGHPLVRHRHRVVADFPERWRRAKVKTIRDEKRIVVDYAVEGDFPSTATTTTGWTRSPRHRAPLHGASSPTTPTAAADPPASSWHPRPTGCTGQTPLAPGPAARSLRPRRQPHTIATATVRWRP